MGVFRITLFFCGVVIVNSGYPPIGDEVQPGSVLLPATRRGRYLANIVRRQAVDGTGIKFNKDADRMNAEAKKKVDVLSEELLPYIIAEQERRTTLYKRVMTAIQNGEKGVTIAEIRNKPPLIIRKGLMFRCPANRVPKEPDGSGIIMCEEDIEPTPVMYDSCLSAEDRDLYVADNKYFFCNRHKVEGPDLPRNGSTVIGCAPSERTSLNYTSMKCALEDTDDVVVHYRYYPDRTYKFVTELDPDREVCDHWNPCQIGYIYSLPSPDQALPANELWRDYKIVPPIAEDIKSEYVRPNRPYTTAPRTLRIPEGFKFDSIWKQQNPYSNKAHDAHRVPQSFITTKEFEAAPVSEDGRRSGGQLVKFITITITFPKFIEAFLGTLFCIFLSEDGSHRNERSIELVTIEKATIDMDMKKFTQMPQGPMDPALIEYKCQRCRVVGIVVRGDDGLMYNLEATRYKLIQTNDGKKAVQIQLNNAQAKDFGTYMITFQNDDGIEEVIQAFQIHLPEVDHLFHVALMRSAASVGGHLDQHLMFTCDGECEMTDVTCNGESVTAGGRISIVPAAKMISFNFPSFEDANACAYVGVFKQDGRIYRKLLAVIETVTVAEHTAPSPSYGEAYEFEVAITADSEFEVVKVTVNGVEIEGAPTRRSSDPPRAYYVASQNSISVHIAEFSELYEGVYMAVLKFDHGNVTKMIAHIKGPSEEDSPSDTTASASPDAANSTDASAGSDAPTSGAPDAAASDAPPADAPPADAPPADAPPADAPPAEK